MQDLGNEIFVQSEDRRKDDFKSLSERASEVMKGIKDKEAYTRAACEKWLDVRSFGQVFSFKSMGEKEQINVEDKVVYFMSIDGAKFRSPVRPGDRLEYRLEVLKHRGNIWVLGGQAYVDDNLVAEAELKAMIVDK